MHYLLRLHLSTSVIFFLLLHVFRLNEVHGLRLTSKKSALFAFAPPVQHGEGPFWDEEKQILYYVDIAGFSIYSVDLKKNLTVSSLTLNDTVSFVIPIKGEPNKFTIGLGLSVQILTWDGVNGSDYKLELISSVDKNKPANRFNDAKSDPYGVLWAGTMGHEDSNGLIKPEQGSLYSWSSEECDMKPKISPVTISNGLVWSRNRSLLYYIDSSTRRIDVFDYNGTISNRRVAFDLEEHKVPGYPDGMTIDENDFLWIACWGSSRIIQVDPNKRKLLRTVKLPIERVTSVTFGGPDMDILFITSMRHGLNSSQLEEQPLAGTTFAITDLSAKGLPAHRVTFNCDKKNLQ